MTTYDVEQTPGTAEENVASSEVRRCSHGPDEDGREAFEDHHIAATLSRYSRYDLNVDEDAGDRATELHLGSVARPHMRAFHCSWLSFHVLFFLWFSITPLLGEIQLSLGLTRKQIWTSSIVSDFAAVPARLIAGPICDVVGPRLPMAVLLIVTSLPTFLIGTIHTSVGLSLLRFGLGLAGTGFVFATFWGSRMFVRDITGITNGWIAGWGNAGAAAAQVIMGSALFPLFEYLYRDRDNAATLSWRTIGVIPAFVALMWGLTVARISDDAPLGYYRDMKKNGTMDPSYYARYKRSGWTNPNVWLLAIQYAGCFGVELAVNNGISLYYYDTFGLSTEAASGVASLFGWMNLFARFAGGKLSDTMNMRYGLRGRLWVQSISLFCQGGLILLFAYMDSLPSSIVALCLFSIFVQASEGAIYGTVPYVSLGVTGAAAGIVGAGGNIGGMAFDLAFRQLSYRSAYIVMGSVSLAASFASLGIAIPGHAGLITGEDSAAAVGERERTKRRRAQIVAAKEAREREAQASG